MKKLLALLMALILGLFSATTKTVVTNSIDTPTETKAVEWAIGYAKRCNSRKVARNWTSTKRFIRRVALAPLMLFLGTAAAEEPTKRVRRSEKFGRKTKLDGVTVLNDGNPSELGSGENLFTVSPSTAKKCRGYYTNKPVPLTKYELKMPGVVVCQNRGMIFSSARPVSGDYVIPALKDLNLIVVDEVSRKLKPVDDEENKVFWKGKGKRVVKDVIADGQGQHWFCTKAGKLAVGLWLKVAKFIYGLKGMIQPGLITDVGQKVKDHWGVWREITLGNTLLVNSSMVKGLAAYDSLEDLIAHGEEWGLTKLMKQWQSGDHRPANHRIMGTQANATNLEQTPAEIEGFLRPEAREIWAHKFPRVAWMKSANIETARGRAIAARPSLVYKNLVINQINTKAGNMFLRLAQGKFMAEGQYLKMYMDKLVYSYVYVHGMDPNAAAKKAAATGLHGEIRVSPAFAGRYYETDESGAKHVKYKKDVQHDNKGAYVEVALVRYPHGAPSETIIVKAYLDDTCPRDVILFPAPVANDDGTISVGKLFAMRLQGADFDGDAVTAYTEKVWLEAQKRNAGKYYMVIPVNTEGAEKDKTLVTDETFAQFCEQKVLGLSNQVGLIATSLKYFLSQCIDMIKEGCEPGVVIAMIVDHACAMGDDIDEFKHGKAENELVPFVVTWVDGNEVLYSPYFNRYAMKYKSEEDFLKACFRKDKKGEYTIPKYPGKGILDTYATKMKTLMDKAGLEVVEEVAEASDGKNRWFFTVKPAKWEPKEVELHITKGEGSISTALPESLEKAYGIKHGTTFSAKDLFRMLYRDHSATCKSLMSDCTNDDKDRDQAIKNLIKLNERYALAKVSIIAWTKAMKAAKGETVTAEEALKIFTTIMVQHNSKNRSIIDTLTKSGSFKRADGTPYEVTVFAAERCFNYFLDLCGDGLLFLGEEKPDFPEVSEAILEAANATMPNLGLAKEKARRELAEIDKIVGNLDKEIETVTEEIDATINPDPDSEDEDMGPSPMTDADWAAEEAAQAEYLAGLTE